jgi:hypothetical protein
MRGEEGGGGEGGGGVGGVVHRHEQQPPPSWKRRGSASRLWMRAVHKKVEQGSISVNLPIIYLCTEKGILYFMYGGGLYIHIYKVHIYTPKCIRLFVYVLYLCVCVSRPGCGRSTTSRAGAKRDEES